MTPWWKKHYLSLSPCPSVLSKMLNSCFPSFSFSSSSYFSVSLCFFLSLSLSLAPFLPVLWTLLENIPECSKSTQIAGKIQGRHQRDEIFWTWTTHWKERTENKKKQDIWNFKKANESIEYKIVKMHPNVEYVINWHRLHISLEDHPLCKQFLGEGSPHTNTH